MQRKTDNFLGQEIEYLYDPEKGVFDLDKNPLPFILIVFQDNKTEKVLNRVFPHDLPEMMMKMILSAIGMNAKILGIKYISESAKTLIDLENKEEEPDEYSDMDSEELFNTFFEKLVSEKTVEGRLNRLFKNHEKKIHVMTDKKYELTYSRTDFRADIFCDFEKNEFLFEIYKNSLIEPWKIVLDTKTFSHNESMGFKLLKEQIEC
jgi:hypothetical protein